MQRNIPLCIDCDGTLLKTDLLHEALLLLLRQSPLSIFLLPVWLIFGRARFKEKLASRVNFNWSSLPYREEIVEAAHTARQAGRKVVLATASPRVWAVGVADHCNLFDEVFSSEAGLNLSGTNKAARLSTVYGEGGFEYAGNSRADISVWKMSAAGIVVSSDNTVIRAARNVTQISSIIPVRAARLTDYLRALRLHQWLKNILVGVPLIAAHELTRIESLLNTTVAFFSFCLCASSVYILNDLFDLESDRLHVRKRNRPFASTLIPIDRAAVMLPLCLLPAFFLSLKLPVNFLIVLITYLTLTFAYSLRLKKQIVVDVFLLAILYTIRIIGGSAATNIIPSFWLLALSMFIFLSLAIVKRYSEMLITLKQKAKSASGRGYTVDDLPVLLAIGVSASMASVLVLALYINSPETQAIYPTRIWLWGIPPLILYWVSRVWMKAHRGEIDDDPVVFAALDWQSAITALLALTFLSLARYGQA